MIERLTDGKFKNRHGLYYEPFYHSLCQKLCDMKRRCSNKNDPSYYLYGGRGIKVCDEWADPQGGHEAFYEWAINDGYRKGMSIERIDNNGNYDPNNCRWATPKEQANNRRTNKYLTIGNTTKSITEWANIFNFDGDLANRRYNRGVPTFGIFAPVEKSTSKRQVVRLNDMKEYTSLSDAARDINGSADKISLVCRGKRLHHKGYKFAFKEDVPCQKIS